MKNYRSTISGAFAAVGVLLWGTPFACAQFSGPVTNIIPVTWYRWMILGGIICNILGVFFGHLFSADAKQVGDLKAQVQENAEAIKTGDTSFMRPSPVVEETKLPNPITGQAPQK